MNPLQDRTFVTDTTMDGDVATPVVAGTVIRLSFRAGRLGAHAGCNAVDAPLTVEPGRLRTGVPISTLMLCGEDRMAQESWLVRFLCAAPEWSLSGNALLLRSGREWMALTEEVGGDTADAPGQAQLWGTTFESVDVTGKVAAPVVPGTTITLSFTAPDRLTARAGCNTLGFRVVAGTDRLTVDDAVSCTRMACTPELMAQDDWLAAFLTGGPEYALTGPALTLTRGGTTIELRVRVSPPSSARR